MQIQDQTEHSIVLPQNLVVVLLLQSQNESQKPPCISGAANKAMRACSALPVLQTSQKRNGGCYASEVVIEPNQPFV